MAKVRYGVYGVEIGVGQTIRYARYAVHAGAWADAYVNGKLTMNEDYVLQLNDVCEFHRAKKLDPKDKSPKTWITR